MSNKSIPAVLRAFQKLEPRRIVERNAILGNGDGSTVATGNTNEDYVRLSGQASRVVRALNLTGIHTYGIAVDVEVIKHALGVRGQVAQYEVVGPAKSVALAGVPPPPVNTHNVLSATHLDSLPASPVAGDLIVANSTPKWARFAKGTAPQLLKMVAGAVTWALAALSELSDVTIATPTDNQVLVYDGSVWRNAAIAVDEDFEVAVDESYNVVFDY